MKKSCLLNFYAKNIFALLLLFYYLDNLQAQNIQSRLWSIPPKQIGFPSLSVSNLPGTGLFPYNGSPATYASNAMHDANGNLLFFVVDGSVWDKNGRWIGDINVTAIGDRVTGTSEWIIVPVPGNCKQYYLIGGRYTSTNPNVGGVPIPYYIVVDLSLTGVDPSAIGGFTTPVAKLLTTFSPNVFLTGSTNMAVTPLRQSGDRLLFVGDNINIYRFRITGNGIVYDNYFTPDLPFTLHAPGTIARTEMEVIKLINGNYRLALGYEVVPGCPSPNFPHQAIFVGDFDASGTLISSGFYPLSCFFVPKYFIKGLEFSPNGRYLYATHTEPPYIQFIDLQASTPSLIPLNPALPNSNSIPIPKDFEYSQIELGNNGLLYFTKSNGLAALSNPNTPTINGVWNDLAIPMTVALSSVLGGGPKFDLRLMNDQIDGEVYQDYGIASPPHFCCIDNTPFTTDAFSATASGIWQPGSNPFTNSIGNSNIVTVRDKLIIPSGINITIQGMIFQFAPGTSGGKGGKVEVGRGGTLTLNNTTFTSYNGCGGGMWQGIEVWGNKNSPQSDISAQGQGRVIIYSNSVIENAFEGITTIKTNPNGTQDWNFTGGIIRATNSAFKNCFRAAQFLSYSFQNTSYFTNCVFETTGLLIDPTTKPYVFVSLYNVKGVQFLGCTFRNSSPNSFSQQDRGRGIVSIDAAYTVNELCLSQSFPCSLFKPNKFENLYYGLDASNASNLNTVFIRKAEFTGNSQGMLLSNNKNATIISNKFDVGFLNDNSPYGLYLNLCRGYQVEDNDFISAQNQFSIGTIVNNADVNHRIYRNRYRDNSIGFQYQNQVPVPSSLQIKCNDFSLNAPNDVDIAITSGFIGNQGSCSNNITTPAGNLFSFCLLNPPVSPLNKNIWTNTTGVGGFNYYHHPDPSTTPMCYTSGKVALSACTTAYVSGSCPSTLINPCNPVCQKVIANNTGVQINALNSQIIAGNAAVLYQVIASNSSPGQIKDALTASGSYLSDGVLVAAITRPNQLPPGHIKDIVIPNSPVTQTVKNTLNNISLPNGIRNQINAAQQTPNPSDRALAEQQLEILQLQYDIALNSLLQQYLSDISLANPIDSVIAFLVTQNNLPSQQSLVQAYLAKGSCSDARTTYNQISARSDAIFNSFTDLSISLCEQEKTIFELTSSQKQLLENLSAQNSNLEVAARAQSILHFVDGASFPEVIEDLDVPESLTIHGFVNRNASCGGGPAVGDTITLIDASGTIVPNIEPAITDENGKFVFNYFDIASLLLDNTNPYSLATGGTLPLENMPSFTIADWISQSPQTFTKGNGQDSWTQKADFGGGFRAWASSFSIGNKAYMGLGAYPLSTYHNDFWEWNQAADTWTQKANLPAAVRGNAVGFSIGSKGYIGTGGVFGGSYYNDFWEFDPAANTWTQKANFPGTPRVLGAGFAIGSKGYIGTGLSNSGLLGDFWEYDPSSDTWTQRANFGGTVRLGVAAFSIGSKGYMGTGDDGQQVKDFWEWDQITDTWTRKADFGGEERGTDVGFAIGTKGYIGTGYHNGVYLDDFWEWDQATDSWTQVLDYPQGPASSATGLSGFALGNKGYVGGGGSSATNFYKSFWEYTPAGTTACIASSQKLGSSGKQNETSSSQVSAVNVYPNPNKGTFSVECTISDTETGEFELYDLVGRKQFGHILQGGENSLTISEQNLISGIYFYRLLSNGALMRQGKVVVIK